MKNNEWGREEVIGRYKKEWREEEEEKKTKKKSLYVYADLFGTAGVCAWR